MYSRIWNQVTLFLRTHAITGSVCGFSLHAWWKGLAGSHKWDSVWGLLSGDHKNSSLRYLYACMELLAGHWVLKILGVQSANWLLEHACLKGFWGSVLSFTALEKNDWWQRKPIAVRNRLWPYKSGGEGIDRWLMLRQTQNSCCSVTGLYCNNVGFQGNENNLFQQKKGVGEGGKTEFVLFS